MTVFSQVGTGSTKEIDTSSVVLPKNVAMQVIKDILYKDYLSEENSLLNSTNYLLSKNGMYKDSLMYVKDSMLSLCKSKEYQYMKIVQIKDTQLVSYKNMQDKLVKENVKLNRKLAFTRTVAVMFLITTTFLFGMK